MGGGDIKIIRQLAVGNHIINVLRQALTHIVVHFFVGFGIAHIGGDSQRHKHSQEHRESLGDLACKTVGVADQRLMARPLQRAVKQQNQRGQHGHAADYAQQHALGHHNAQVAAHGEAHEAQGDKARDGGDGGAQHRHKGFVDGLGHGLVFILNVRALLIVAIPQEDGIVHRHGQLQHGGQRLGDIGNLAQEVVAAQVDHNADADTGQEDQRRQPAVQQQHHGQARAGHSQRHIDGLFLLAQIL